MPIGILTLMIFKCSDKEEINNTKKKSTVVVAADDDRDNLLLIGFVLNALKLKYYLADNGKTALDLVYDKKPSLVLLDVVMPYLNGIEANTLIKNDLFTNHISTIAITGLRELEHIETIQDAGFNDYIVKPFMIEDLETRIKHFIKN